MRASTNKNKASRQSASPCAYTEYSQDFTASAIPELNVSHPSHESEDERTHIGHDISSSNSPRASSTCAFLAFLSRPSFAVLAFDELPLVDFRGLASPFLARFLGGDVSSSRRMLVGVGGRGVPSGSA